MEHTPIGNMILIALMFVGRLWILWAAGTFLLAALCWLPTRLLGHPQEQIWQVWTKWGAALPFTLLAGKKKKKGGH